jgi:hypothetical protein
MRSSSEDRQSELKEFITSNAGGWVARVSQFFAGLLGNIWPIFSKEIRKILEKYSRKMVWNEFQSNAAAENTNCPLLQSCLHYR